MRAQSLGLLQICDPWTVSHQVPLSMGVFRQEYWNVLLCPSAGGFPKQGIKSRSPTLQADPLPSGSPRKQEY